MRWEESGRGLVVTLDDGDRGNYLSPDEIAEIGHSLEIAEQKQLKWWLIRQAGQDFCLGRAEGGTPGPGGAGALIALVRQLREIQGVVTLSAADGGCVGFGVGLCALADISVVTTRSWFQFPEMSRGVVPGVVASWVFDSVPARRAQAWMMTGRRFDAAEAFASGLVTRLVGQEEFGQAIEAELASIEGLRGNAGGELKALSARMLAADPTARYDIAADFFRQRGEGPSARR